MSDSEGDEDLNDWGLLDARVLKRGEKDHAPDGTSAQQNVLQASRNAMYTALKKPASTARKNVVLADWDSKAKQATVRQVRGSFFNSMGWADRHGTYLLPEEVIYLAERGTLVCHLDGKALSVQGVIAHCLGLVGVDRMQVYSHLRRLGYVVRRDVRQPDVLCAPTSNNHRCSSDRLIWAICGRFFSRFAWKPRYTSFLSVFRDLQVVRQQGAFEYPAQGSFDFLVWKPGSQFKKSQPPVPDFRIRVVSAESGIPSLGQIAVTMGLAPITPSKKRTAIARVKEGYRSFIYAVVDNSVIGFVRAVETDIEESDELARF